jgi:pyruvate,water dikinase
MNVILFSELQPEQQILAGGKASTLAQLTQRGYPVPAGFVILPSAFEGDELSPSVWSQICEQLAVLRKNGENISFAVRSSALAEDSSEASFAGAFETRLNVSSDAEIQEAIHAIRASGTSDRVRLYSQVKHIDSEMAVAVIVQKMLHTEISGVLFTADPVTGSGVRMTGNYVSGLGDKLVSGEVDADLFEFQRPRGKYSGPDKLKKHARKLYQLAVRIEKELGKPQDIEWAIADGKVYLLQSRPITTLIVRNSAIGEWNDSLSGDYLWSNVNFGEAVTQTLTPLAWSVLQFSLDDWVFLPEMPTVGSICGNPYLNISIFATLFKAIGRSQEDLLKFMESTLYIKLPDEMTIPLIPISPAALFGGIGNFLQIQIKQRRGIRRIQDYLDSNLVWFQQIEKKLGNVKSKSGLLTLWESEIAPHVKQGVWTVLGTATYSADYTMALHRRLAKLVGSEDATILIGNVNDETDLLPSLGPAVGLAKVAAGEMSRFDYLEKYGHRGPHEFEISKPRPIEDPEWLEEQLVQLHSTPLEVDAILNKKRLAFERAWERFGKRYPNKAQAMHRRLEENTRRTRLREEARSAYIRDRWSTRLFSLRAGELIGAGEKVFYLYLDEIFAALRGDDSALTLIPTREITHHRNLEYPPFPSIIRGRFLPAQWVADPQRRSDIFDAQALASTQAYADKSNYLTGAPGSAGRIEGVVRVLKVPSDGNSLQPGEILVTTQTDISWTVLFPRTAAIITDIGAPLSHAAIVARELGIPAVVGCGDATMRLKTGDTVRVDGGNGVVEIIRKSMMDSSK